MKKLMKNNYKFIFGLIFGVIISCVTMYTVHAVSSFSSTDIEHKLLNNSTTTVKQALDDLYTLHSLGTADASHLLAGKTAISGGSFISGLMTDYSNSTAIACTTNNTSNKLYIKPNNNGYYTTASSFDTGISYNPNRTVASGNAGTITSDGTTNSTSITLGVGKKVTISKGYYSSDITVTSGGSEGAKILKVALTGNTFSMVGVVSNYTSLTASNFFLANPYGYATFHDNFSGGLTFYPTPTISYNNSTGTGVVYWGDQSNNDPNLTGSAYVRATLYYTSIPLP